MIGRSVRSALSALAIWAFLFAPGAVAAESRAVSEAADPERVAAAIVAPTFGTDGVIKARSWRDDDSVPAERVLDGDVPLTPIAKQHDSIPQAAASDATARAQISSRLGPPTRGPPEG